ALGLAGGSERVDEEQGTGGCGGTAACGATRQLERGPRGCQLECRLCQRAVLVLDEQQGRVGVVELVGDLRRREPPREREQDRARLRAREEDGDVLRGVAGERRDARARLE